MEKGILSRLIIDEILISLRNDTYNFDHLFEIKIKNKKITLSDKKLIQNVVFCSMRNFFSINRIIKLYVKKLDYKSDNYFLLLSAISQLIFLDFKEYAVVNSTVEIAKSKKKANSKFINSVLRNIVTDKNKIKINNDNLGDLPNWFLKKIVKWSNEKKLTFIKTIKKRPSLNIAFKSIDDLKKSGIIGQNTSETSMIPVHASEVNKINGYNEGYWWVQDLSVMLPIYLLENINNKYIADMCAAPGGKTFQLLAKKARVDSYEINPKKFSIMKENLKRLNYNQKIILKDSLKIDNNTYNIAVLDAPCSSVGTIRRNPEIFYRNSSPNFNKITTLQTNLLEKAKNIIMSKGYIIYMVCSFLSEEGEEQINKFLDRNKNFKLEKFKTNNDFYSRFITKRGFIHILPQNINEETLIDGFFAAKIKRDA